MTHWLCPIFGFLFGFSAVSAGVSLWRHQESSVWAYGVLAAVSFFVLLVVVAASAGAK